MFVMSAAHKLDPKQAAILTEVRGQMVLEKVLQLERSRKVGMQMVELLAERAAGMLAEPEQKMFSRSSGIIDDFARITRSLRQIMAFEEALLQGDLSGMMRMLELTIPPARESGSRPEPAFNLDAPDQLNDRNDLRDASDLLDKDDLTGGSIDGIDKVQADVAAMADDMLPNKPAESGSDGDNSPDSAAPADFTAPADFATPPEPGWRDPEPLRAEASRPKDTRTPSDVPFPDRDGAANDIPRRIWPTGRGPP